MYQGYIYIVMGGITNLLGTVYEPEYNSVWYTIKFAIV